MSGVGAISFGDSSRRGLSSSLLEQVDLLNKEDSFRFTSAQMAEPNKFIEKLEKRVAVLEKIEKNKKRAD